MTGVSELLGLRMTSGESLKGICGSRQGPWAGRGVARQDVLTGLPRLDRKFSSEARLPRDTHITEETQQRSPEAAAAEAASQIVSQTRLKPKLCEGVLRRLCGFFENVRGDRNGWLSPKLAPGRSVTTC
jgi:hypothetical protein